MSQPNYKSYLKLFALVAGGGALALIAVNWRVDPLQFYRQAAYPPLLVEQKRFQAPGLAKNYDYDTVVVGTSMSENFQPQQVTEKLGGRALNLSMQGASVREQSLILQVALRSGRVKRVVWEINYEYLRGDPQWVANYDGSFPFYFYDENAWNELGNYLLSLDTTKQTVKVLAGRIGLRHYRSLPPEEVFSWYRTKQFGAASVKTAWQRAVKARESFRRQLPEYALENLNANFDRNVLPLLRAHPEVKFDLLLPPFLAAYYVNVRAVAPQILTNLLANRRHILACVEELPHVRLFDFQADPQLIFAVDDYCDLMHFDLRINDRILEALRDGRNRMTAAGAAKFETLVGGEELFDWTKATVE